MEYNFRSVNVFDSNYEDEYKRATKGAMVNAYDGYQSFNWKALFINSILLSFFGAVGYFGFIYLKQETTFFHNKTMVMGISHTVSDAEYTKSLNAMYADELKEESKTVNVSDALSNIVNTSTLRDDSLYTQAISQEIDGSYHKNSRIILVKQGDTLASISEEYYGNSTNFKKIIENNKELTSEFHMLYVGQKLNLPY